MSAAKPRSLLLSSRCPQTIRAHVLFFYSRGGEGIHRCGAESFSSSSSPSPPHASPPQWRHHHHDEDSKGVKVAVWWDFENCNVPNGVNVFRVPHRITSALRSHGIRGPVSITAFGDVSQLSRSTQDALYTSGVGLNHVPSCGKNSSDRSLLADLVYWVAQNPPPVHFFLISGDRDFANILHRLRMNNYNILLACTDGASGALCSAATVMWQWNSLVRGENLTGKYFNHPPDGMHSSWYGHFRGALENPFPDTEDMTSLQPEELMESLADTKPRQIPKPLVNKIRQILYSHPEGISLTDLRAELKRNNVVLDKDYFGHKKFSHLLLSMPSVLRFNFNPGDTQPLVYGVHQRMTDPINQKSKPTAGVAGSTGDGVQTRPAENDEKLHSTPQPVMENPPHKGDMAIASKCSDRDTDSVDTAAKGQSSLHCEDNVDTSHTQDNMGTTCKEVDVQPNYTHSSEAHNKVAVDKEGLFGKLWKKLMGRGSESSEQSNRISETESTSHKTPCAGISTSVGSHPDTEGMGPKTEVTELKTIHSATDKLENKLNAFQDPLLVSKNHPNTNASAPCETSVNQGPDSGFFSWILMWCRFGKTKDCDAVAQENQVSASGCSGESVEGRELDQCAVSGTNLSPLGSQPEPHDLFSKSYFWDSVESFLRTSKGLDLISKSRTREELMYGLQKEGPLVLSCLKEGHLHQLVNLLIVDKKWLKECASLACPFKLTFPAKRNCIPSHANAVNDLRSVFSNRIQSNSRVLSKQDVGNQNHQPNGNSFSGSVDARLPKDILDMKAWCQRTWNKNRCISSKEFEKYFERAYERKLDCSLYGYFTVDDLVAACNADDHLKSKNISREVTLSHCKNLLMDFLKHNPQGFNIGLFRPMFFRRYGYVLDYQMLGYPKLASLIQIMPGVKIESSIVLPVPLFHPDSRKERGIADELHTCSLESSKAGEDSLDNQDPTNDEDPAWEELGPISTTEKSKPAEEKVVCTESAVVEEEFSDPDECPAVSDGSNKRAYDRNNASSAFLEVLDNYYGGQGMKEGIEKDKASDSSDSGEEDNMQAAKEGIDIYQAHALDGLVDCSRKMEMKAGEPKPLDLLLQKLKSHKSCSFI